MKGFIKRAIRFRLRTLIFAVSILSLYLASYLALREPVVRYDSTTRFDAKGDMSIRLWPVNDPEYRIGGHFSRTVFSPIAWVDWQLREDYWVQRHWERVKRECRRPTPHAR